MRSLKAPQGEDPTAAAWMWQGLVFAALAGVLLWTMTTSRVQTRHTSFIGDRVQAANARDAARARARARHDRWAARRFYAQRQKDNVATIGTVDVLVPAAGGLPIVAADPSGLGKLPLGTVAVANPADINGAWRYAEGHDAQGVRGRRAVFAGPGPESGRPWRLEVRSTLGGGEPVVLLAGTPPGRICSQTCFVHLAFGEAPPLVVRALATAVDTHRALVLPQDSRILAGLTTQQRTAIEVSFDDARIEVFRVQPPTPLAW